MLGRGIAPEMDETTRATAERHFREGYEAQVRGDLDTAITHYRQSIAAVPTAEAHTFLGWALSHRGDYAGAIRECQTAITVDPDFGNPYNDIGSYLIALGRHDEAIGVEYAGGARAVDAADLGDPAAADPDVGGEPGCAGAVDDAAAPDHGVELGHGGLNIYRGGRVR